VFGYLRRTNVSRSGEYWLRDTVASMAQDGRKVRAFTVPGSVFWRDIGKMERRLEAERHIQNSGRRVPET